MNYCVKFENQVFQNIADECGLLIDTDNREVTQKEIEFFAEQLINKCAMISRKMEIHNTPFVGVKILEHFGVK